ncbi:MAG: glycine oxidase ThiO [Flavobacteriales bacterium]
MKIGIIGGGIIGLSCAWQLLRNGYEVEVLEKGEIGENTSTVAGGMLAPQAELQFEEFNMYKIEYKSLELWDTFLEELNKDTTDNISINKCGTLFAGIDRDDTEHIRRLYEFRKNLGLDVTWLSGSETRDMESDLSARVVSGMYMKGDAVVNNNAVINSLIKAIKRKNGRINDHTKATKVEKKRDKGVKVHTTELNKEYDDLIIAAGNYVNQIEGLQAESFKIRPLKGQIIFLKRNEEINTKRMIRHPRGYLVPQSDGTLRIGATSEEKGFDDKPTAGGIKDILDNAWEIVPSIYDLSILDIKTGFRPSTPDHAPVIGRNTKDGILYATGLFRHGILLTPLTAYAVCNEIIKGKSLKMVKPLRPERFQQ